MFAPPLFGKTDDSKLPYYLREQKKKMEERAARADAERKLETNNVLNETAAQMQEKQLNRLKSYQLFPADPFVASHHPICPRRTFSSFSALSNNGNSSALKPPFCNAKSCLFPPAPASSAPLQGPDDPNIPRFNLRRPTTTSVIGQERQYQVPLIQSYDDPPAIMQNGSKVSVWLCSHDLQLCVASAHTRGFRDEMEDVFIEYKGSGGGNGSNDALGDIYVFGVCDGHGGAQVANWLHANLGATIVSSLRRGETLEEAFAATQAKLATDIAASTLANIGSTVCIAIVLPQHNLYYVANCGDSRAILVDLHSPATMSRRITTDHKPDEPGEKHRIERSGGAVLSMFGVARLNGALSVSRGFGDNAMRPFGFTERPDIYGPFVLQEKHPIVLACDGLFDVVTDAGAAMTAAHNLCGWTASPLALEQTVFAQRAVEQLRNVAFASNSRDNISVMLLLPHKKML